MLYLITFVTSILALVLYETVLRHPRSYIAGAGHDKQVLFGALLELLLIIANIGTAVVIFPIVRRKNEELALGYVTARIVECTFILVGIVAMSRSSRCGNRSRVRLRDGRLHARRDQGLDISPRTGLGRRLGERTDPRLPDVPLRTGAATDVLARPHRRAADHRVRDGPDVRRQPPEPHDALAAGHRDHPGVRVGTVPRRLLHGLGIQARRPDPFRGRE